MFCRNCGSKIEDGAKFCPVCGESVTAALEGGVEAQPDGAAAPTDEMPAVGINAPANEAAATPAPAKAKRSKKPLVIAAVVAALLAAGGGAGYYFGVYAPEQAREAAEQEALAAKHAVRFSVSAQGWDTSAGASRLPVRITGREERGEKVDAVRYVDSDGEGVELRRGSYKVEVAASPIAADGTVYAVPAEKLSIKLGEKAAEKKAVDAGDVTLEPVEAAEVTDDQIAAAKKYAEGDKGAKKAGFSIDAEALATAATKRRDDAVAAKQAEEEARRQAEEEARKAEEAKQARTFDTDDFVMVLPDWFPIDEYEVTKEGNDNWGVIRFEKRGSDPDATSFEISLYDASSFGGIGSNDQVDMFLEKSGQRQPTKSCLSAVAAARKRRHIPLGCLRRTMAKPSHPASR